MAGKIVFGIVLLFLAYACAGEYSDTCSQGSGPRAMWVGAVGPNRIDCINECMNRRAVDGSIKGCTFGIDPPGECWCERDISSVNTTFRWYVTCNLAPAFEFSLEEGTDADAFQLNLEERRDADGPGGVPRRGQVPGGVPVPFGNPSGERLPGGLPSPRDKEPRDVKPGDWTGAGSPIAFQLNLEGRRDADENEKCSAKDCECQERMCKAHAEKFHKGEPNRCAEGYHICTTCSAESCFEPTNQCWMKAKTHKGMHKCVDEWYKCGHCECRYQKCMKRGAGGAAKCAEGRDLCKNCDTKQCDKELIACTASRNDCLDGWYSCVKESCH